MRSTLQTRKDADQSKRERLQHGLACGQKIVIDLDYAASMSPSEIKSLCQQVAAVSCSVCAVQHARRSQCLGKGSMPQLPHPVLSSAQVAYSYASVVRCPAAVHLMLSGLEGAVGESLAKQASGSVNWIISRTTESFTNLFPNMSDIVYLTAGMDSCIPLAPHACKKHVCHVANATLRLAVLQENSFPRTEQNAGPSISFVKPCP